VVRVAVVAKAAASKVEAEARAVASPAEAPVAVKAAEVAAVAEVQAVASPADAKLNLNCNQTLALFGERKFEKDSMRSHTTH
jgi:hypothetical protein